MNREEVLSNSLKHNFWTWSAQSKVDVMPIEKAQGVYFWDFNGQKYLDLNSMVMCVNIGHGNQNVIDAIVAQAKELPFAGPHMATKPRAELGMLLASILPPELNRFFYTLGGSDANENAVKFARAVTGKFKILTRYRSYHGATMGAMALTGDRRRLAWEPNTMPGVVHFLDPYIYRSNFYQGLEDIKEEQFTAAYLKNLEEVISYEGPQTIAAILVETVTGTNGIIIPPKGYLKGVREICDRYGILLITDEVMCGFGRTGRWFAFQHWDVVPDMVTMAKGLTSAYAPLGAVAMRPEIANHFNERVYYGGLTYNANHLGMAAAVANINVIKDEKLVEKAANTGEYLTSMLQELKAKHPSVGDVRSIGLFAAIELVKSRKTKEPLSGFNQPTSEVMGKVKQFIIQNGIYVHTHFNLILIIPPLIIEPEELKAGIEIIDEALKIADKVYES